jgi:cell division initiation protein
MSKLTPIDLPHQQFNKSFRGYEPREVLQFLQEVSVQWEETLRENKQLRDKAQDQSEEIKRLQGNEKNVKETMVTAQKMTEQLNVQAKKESELIIGQAEIQAEKILQQAHERLTEIITQINDMKKQRAEFQGNLRGMIETHLRLLSMEIEDRKESRIENIGIISKVSGS